MYVPLCTLDLKKMCGRYKFDGKLPRVGTPSLCLALVLRDVLCCVLSAVCCLWTQIHCGNSTQQAAGHITQAANSFNGRTLTRHHTITRSKRVVIYTTKIILWDAVRTRVGPRGHDRQEIWRECQWSQYWRRRNCEEEEEGSTQISGRCVGLFNQS